jgi:hypothetical protein
LIGDLGDETVNSAGRKLPLVAIVTLGGGVLGDSSNYDEIANVPQVHTLAEGLYFSRFSRSVGLTWRDSWEWDIAVVELEAGTGGGLADHPNLCPKFLDKTVDDYLLILIASSAPTRLLNGWFKRDKQLSFPCHSLLSIYALVIQIIC